MGGSGSAGVSAGIQHAEPAHPSQEPQLLAPRLQLQSEAGQGQLFGIEMHCFPPVLAELSTLMKWLKSGVPSGMDCDGMVVMMVIMIMFIITCVSDKSFTLTMATMLLLLLSSYRRRLRMILEALELYAKG